MKKVSIVIAVYNEKDSLSKVLEKIRDIDIGLEKEVIIVDGCSTDGTRDILKERQSRDTYLKVIFEEEKNGKGLALRKGFAVATGDIILIQDADLEIDPVDYPVLLAPILGGSSDIVYGSRFLKGRGKLNHINYFGNRFVTTIANIFFGANLTDIETCYKVFRPSLIKDMDFSCDGFDFDAELTSMFLRKRYKIHEVPITYNPRSRRQGKKLRWTVALPSLAAILRCKFK